MYFSVFIRKLLLVCVDYNITLLEQIAADVTALVQKKSKAKCLGRYRSAFMSLFKIIYREGIKCRSNCGAPVRKKIVVTSITKSHTWYEESQVVTR